MPDLEGALSKKDLLTHFYDSIKSVLLENFSAEIKTPHLPPRISEYIFWNEFHSMLYFHH